MCGKVQESGLTEIVPLMCTSALWGQRPVLSHPESPQGHRGGSWHVTAWRMHHPRFTDTAAAFFIHRNQERPPRALCAHGRSSGQEGGARARRAGCPGQRTCALSSPPSGEPAAGRAGSPCQCTAADLPRRKAPARLQADTMPVYLVQKLWSNLTEDACTPRKVMEIR